jgi:TonB family protein
MNTQIRSLVLAAVIFAISVAVISCGESSTSEETAAIEIETLPLGDSDDFYQFDEPPVLTSYEAPTYPEIAREKGLEGSVMVKITVGVDGTVEDALILESTDPIFEESALEAAMHSQFKPANLDGAPTKSRVAIPYQFKLDG